MSDLGGSKRGTCPGRYYGEAQNEKIFKLFVRILEVGFNLYLFLIEIDK